MNPSEVAGQDAPVVARAAPRVRLVVEGGGDSGMRIKCRRVVTLLGSRLGCKIALKHKSVSPVHLAIVNDGEQIHASDLVTPTGS